MIIKDLQINKGTSTKNRYQWLADQIKEKQLNMIYFIGETFYMPDSSLADFFVFKAFVQNYRHIEFFIQDIDSLSFKLLKTSGKSLYKIIEKEPNITLFEKIEALNLDDTESVQEYTLEKNSMQISEEYFLDLEKYKEIRKEHAEDLVGVFIDEVLNKKMDNSRKASILSVGVKALLRR